MVERDLLPHSDAEPVGEQRQHLVGRMMIDAHQVGVDLRRAAEDRCDI